MAQGKGHFALCPPDGLLGKSGRQARAGRSAGRRRRRLARRAAAAPASVTQDSAGSRRTTAAHARAAARGLCGRLIVCALQGLCALLLAARACAREGSSAAASAPSHRQRGFQVKGSACVSVSARARACRPHAASPRPQLPHG